MIYISTGYIKNQYIHKIVEQITHLGFKNIELSGGTSFYEDYKAQLLSLKKCLNLNFQCHNYFPPPKKHFVLNLASLDDDIYQTSINHVKSALALSNEFEASRYAVHAGFLIDVQVNQLGQKIPIMSITNEEHAILRFCEAFVSLEQYANSLGVKLYIENNVYSFSNFKNFGDKNPFLLTDKKTYLSLREHINFNLLLDVAHLKVSSKTLNLNFEDELKFLSKDVDYLHVSDNDGFSDQNLYFDETSSLYNKLKEMTLSDKIITLEINPLQGDVQHLVQLLQ